MGNDGINIQVLAEGNGLKFMVLLDLESKHPVDFALVINLNMFAKSILKGFDHSEGSSSHGKVINVYQ